MNFLKFWHVLQIQKNTNLTVNCIAINLKIVKGISCYWIDVCNVRAICIFIR